MKHLFLLMMVFYYLDTMAHNAFEKINAVSHEEISDKGIKIEKIDGARIFYLDFSENGSWAWFQDINFENGNKLAISLDISANQDSEIEVILDKITNSPIEIIQIPKTKNINETINITSKIKNIVGRHDIYLRSRKTPFNLFSFQFVRPENKNSEGQIKALLFSESNKIELEQCWDIDRGQNLQDIKKGSWVKYQNIDVTDKEILKLRVAGLYDGEMEILLDDLGNKPIATVKVPATGGWQKWDTIQTSLPKIKGRHDIYIVFKIPGYNLNWLEFIKNTEIRSGKHETERYLLEKNHHIKLTKMDRWKGIGSSDSIYQYIDKDNVKWIIKFGDFRNEAYALKELNEKLYDNQKERFVVTHFDNPLAIKKQFIEDSESLSSLLNREDFFQNYANSFMSFIQKLIDKKIFIKDLHGGNVLFSYKTKNWYIIDTNCFYQNPFTQDDVGSYLSWYFELKNLYYNPEVKSNSDKNQKRENIKKYFLLPLREKVKEKSQFLYKAFIEHRPVIISTDEYFEDNIIKKMTKRMYWQINKGENSNRIVLTENRSDADLFFLNYQFDHGGLFPYVMITKDFPYNNFKFLECFGECSIVTLNNANSFLETIFTYANTYGLAQFYFYWYNSLSLKKDKNDNFYPSDSIVVSNYYNPSRREGSTYKLEFVEPEITKDSVKIKNPDGIILFNKSLIKQINSNGPIYFKKVFPDLFESFYFNNRSKSIVLTKNIQNNDAFYIKPYKVENNIVFTKIYHQSGSMIKRDKNSNSLKLDDVGDEFILTFQTPLLITLQTVDGYFLGTDICDHFKLKFVNINSMQPDVFMIMPFNKIKIK